MENEYWMSGEGLAVGARLQGSSGSLLNGRHVSRIPRCCYLPAGGSRQVARWDYLQ